MRLETNKNNNYISESKIKSSGRGVYAGKDYKKGDVVDINPFIEIKKNAFINHYSWSCPWNINNGLVVLGDINIINETQETDKQNVFYYHFDKINRSIMCKAIKDIKKDEELLTHYGENYDRRHY
jgi:hypothetical protein